MHSYYHKGGTHVGVCPVPTTFSTLKSDHALTTTCKQAEARIFFVESAASRLQQAAQQPNSSPREDEVPLLDLRRRTKSSKPLDLRRGERTCEDVRGRRRGRGVGGVGAGAGASWLTCSALPPPAPRLRAPKGQSQLIRPNLQVGARSEVKSLQFQELGWGHPTQPRTPTRPARGDKDSARAPTLAHASPAPLHAAKRTHELLTFRCSESTLSRSRGPVDGRPRKSVTGRGLSK